MTRPIVIAIDGPAASGKGTLARRVADAYGLRHLDTGLLYRAVGHALLQAGLPFDNEALAVEVAMHLDMDHLDRAALSAHEIGEAASKVAAMPGVRNALLGAQRNFGNQLPGAVLDGRDIGTVIFPDADIKLFIEASPQVRARRRHDELTAKSWQADYADILADLIKRDERDRNRTEAPLKPAEDAHLIDTSEMDIEAAFSAAKAVIDAHLAEGRS